MQNTPPTYNHILSRMIAHDPFTRRDRAIRMAVLLIGAGMVVAGGVVVAGYPVFTIQALAVGGLMGVIMAIILIATVATASIGRETRRQPYELLFLTNIARERVAWGIMIGVAWQLRLWAVVYPWLVMVAGTATSLLAYDGTLSAWVIIPDLKIPPLYTTLSYAIVWLVFGFNSWLVLVGRTADLGFRDQATIVNILLGGIAKVMNVGITGGIILLAMASAGDDLVWLLASSVVVLVWLMAIGIAVTAHNGLPWTLAWYVYSDSLRTALRGLYVIGVLATCTGFMLVFAVADILGPVLIFVLLTSVFFNIVYNTERYRRDKSPLILTVGILSVVIHTLIALSFMPALAFSGINIYPLLYVSVVWLLLAMTLGRFAAAVSGIRRGLPHIWPTEFNDDIRPIREQLPQMAYNTSRL